MALFEVQGWKWAAWYQPFGTGGQYITLPCEECGETCGMSVLWYRNDGERTRYCCQSCLEAAGVPVKEESDRDGD